MVRPVALLLVSLCLLVAGCGGSDNDTSGSSGAESTPTQSGPDLSNGCAKASQPQPKDVGKIK